LTSHGEVATTANRYKIIERCGSSAAFRDIVTGLEVVGRNKILAPGGVAFHFKGFATLLQPEGFAESLGNLPFFVGFGGREG
jgi:hypothetical protein